MHLFICFFVTDFVRKSGSTQPTPPPPPTFLIVSSCLERSFEKTFSALKINVQTLYMHPFTFLHILKDPKSLTSKPNYQGSMIIPTYIWSRVDYMVWNNYHSICNTFSNLSKIVDIMYPLISKYLHNKLLFKFSA